MTTLSILLCAPASAHGVYAYNYGLDWSQSPFLSNNYFSHAQKAQSYQSAHGYTALAYSSGWASDVYNNMGAVTVMYMSGHSNSGYFTCWNSTSRTWTSDGQQYTSNISCITGNTTHYYSHVVESGSQMCNHSRKLSELSSSPIQIAMFRGCYTGAESPSLLQYASNYAGMDFSGGFTGAVYSVTESGRVPGWYWTDRYWSSLNSGYNAYYSMVRARDYVFSLYSDFYGYDSLCYQGDGNELL